MDERLKSIKIPKRINYISAFLTFRCGLGCSYCINKYNKLKKRRELNGKEWIRGLSRIRTREDLPITLSGGEPTKHQEYFEIIQGISYCDLLTNLEFDIDRFIRNIQPFKFSRKAKYASIRVSYHPERHKVVELLNKVLELKRLGYSIGVWGILFPDEEMRNKTLKAQRVAIRMGIDFRTKEYLGFWKGKLYGSFKYPGSVGSKITKNCECRTSELLIGPAGNIFRCHADLYSNTNSIGNILNKEVPKLGQWWPCSRYGECNPCDLKIKYNRFQEMGHCSVEIKNIK